MHHLKTWPEFFSAVVAGEKSFEVRRDDGRNFMVGDVLNLREWAQDAYTGRAVLVRVTWLVSLADLRKLPGFPPADPHVDEPAWVILAIEPVRASENVPRSRAAEWEGMVSRLLRAQEEGLRDLERRVDVFQEAFSAHRAEVSKANLLPRVEELEARSREARARGSYERPPPEPPPEERWFAYVVPGTEPRELVGGPVALSDFLQAHARTALDAVTALRTCEIGERVSLWVRTHRGLATMTLERVSAP